MVPTAPREQLAKALQEAEDEFLEAQRELIHHNPGAPERFARACERRRALHEEQGPGRDARFHQALLQANEELVTAARAMVTNTPGAAERYDAALVEYQRLCDLDWSVHTPGGTPRVRP